MKLICTQENLKSGLGIASRIISSVNTLPILNNVLLKTENGQLKIFSTNLELAIITNIRCRVEEEGQTTVAAKTISELVNNLPNDNLTLTNVNNELLIQTENQQFKIKTLPAEEFPFIPQNPNPNSVSAGAEILRTAINQVVFAASNNLTQPEISGIFFSFKDKILKLAATDRYRLAEKTINFPGTGEVILPQKTALELSRILSLNPEKVELSLNENQIFITAGATQIISRLVDGQYPDYNSIIPESFNCEVVVEKNRLHSAIKTNALFSQNTNSIKMDYSEDRQLLTISSESQELGSGVVDIPAKVSGSSGGLLLNYRYMLDFLSQSPESNIKIKLVNDSSPAVFTGEEQKDYLYLIMPIKV